MRLLARQTPHTLLAALTALCPAVLQLSLLMPLPAEKLARLLPTKAD